MNASRASSHAGGAMAGIVIAVVSGAMVELDQRLTAWSSVNNPLFSGPHSAVLSMIPFAVICILLYLTGRGVMLKGEKPSS